MEHKCHYIWHNTTETLLNNGNKNSDFYVPYEHQLIKLWTTLWFVKVNKFMHTNLLPLYWILMYYKMLSIQSAQAIMTMNTGTSSSYRYVIYFLAVLEKIMEIRTSR
jgi:hypothetical protein